MKRKRNKIKVHTILEKGTAQINEDCLVTQDNIFGVFDGSTSLDHKRFRNQETGGQIAAKTAQSVFRRNHFPLHRLAREANGEIMDQMIRQGVDVSKKKNLWSTSAAVIRMKADSLEWVQTGDAMILLVYENGSHKVLAEREDHDHETLTLWKELTREKIRPGRQRYPGPDMNGSNPEKALAWARRMLAPQVQKVRSKMNITYGVLNGEKEAEAFLSRGTESLDRVRHILLFTDGLSIPSPTPNKTRDYTPLVKNYLSMGLEGLKNQIRKTENEDPLCIAFPRFKCHDDIAAIALSL